MPLERLYKGTGCRHCRNTGYRGRIAIHEMLVIDDELRDVITSNPTLLKVRQLARQKGMTTLLEDGLQKVREGITTLEEVWQAVGTQLSVSPQETPARST